ncbi:MAG: caspase family protein, partial [Elainellaceae cyanobacterium]
MPKTRALLIGGSEYGQGLTPLKAPLNDVDALARVLRDPKLGHFDQVSTLLNPDPQTLREAVEDLFCLSQKDDLALLFFSGHGLRDDRNRLYFATRLTRKTEKGTLVKSTAVPASFVQDQMGESRSRRQVVILDCCFSGAFAEGMTAKDDGRIDLRSELGGQGRVVLTSSSSTQYAFEQNGTDLSIYTHCIVQGIETGDADTDADGYTAIDELHDYACRKLQEASSAMQPKIYAFDQGFQIHIARAPIGNPKRRYRQDVERLSTQGPISGVGRFVLNELRDSLGLSAVEADAIEATILPPQRSHQEKCQTYRQAVQAALEQTRPLDERTQQELVRFQLMLGVTDQDAAAIYRQVEQHYDSSPAPLAQSQSSIRSTALQPSTFITAMVHLSRSGFLGFGARALTIRRRSQTADCCRAELGQGVVLTMMSIPAGNFVMGSSGAEEGHWHVEE